jgi:hypothetical protein
VAAAVAVAEWCDSTSGLGLLSTRASFLLRQMRDLADRFLESVFSSQRWKDLGAFWAQSSFRISADPGHAPRAVSLKAHPHLGKEDASKLLLPRMRGRLTVWDSMGEMD